MYVTLAIQNDRKNVFNDTEKITYGTIEQQICHVLWLIFRIDVTKESLQQELGISINTPINMFILKNNLNGRHNRFNFTEK